MAQQIEKNDKIILPFQGIFGVERSDAVLDFLFADCNQNRTIGELADLIRVEPEQIKYIVNNLEEHNIVVYNEETDEYGINFNSDLTTGLFSFYRSTILFYFKDLTKKKIDLR